MPLSLSNIDPRKARQLAPDQDVLVPVPPSEEAVIRVSQWAADCIDRGESNGLSFAEGVHATITWMKGDAKTPPDQVR